MEKRFVTINDVAADARVSAATVSRALNEPWRVSPASQERVTGSVEKLGYKPNLRARRYRGIDVPDDVSVVGFNDEDLAQIAEPPLTTIRMPTEEIGAKCVEILNGLMRGQEPTGPVVLPVKLVLRDSAGRVNLRV